MNYNEQMMEIKKIIQNKEYTVAEEKLLSLIDTATVKNIEDENNTYYSFNNYVETILFWYIYQPIKINKNPDINYSQVYYYLGFINIELKNYQKALEYLKKGTQWNPVDVLLFFEIASVYKSLGELERYKAEIEKTYVLIYDSSFMARYYRELGWYYVEKRVFDLANALYTKSISFCDTEVAKNELIFIAKQENREARFSTNEEIKKLFTEYNIRSGFNKKTVDLIYEEYNRLQEYNQQAGIERYLAQRLYDITLDKKFMTYYTLEDEEKGVMITVPETWKYLQRSAYEKANVSPNTTFLLLPPNTGAMKIVCEGKCTNEQLDEKYRINIENMKKQGKDIEKEYEIDNRIKQVFVKFKEGENTSRIFQNYMVVNGYLFCISWYELANFNIDEIYNRIFKDFCMEIVRSLKPISNEDDMIIQRINEEYTKNNISSKLIKTLHIFADSVINKDEQDPFWTETAKNILEIIILTDLFTKNRISIKELVEEVKDNNAIRANIKANLERLSMPELNGIMSAKSILDSEKPFENIMDIIRESLTPSDTKSAETTDGKISIKPNNENDIKTKKTDVKLKEFSQEIPGYPTFKFYFPENIGEYIKYNSNIFEIKRDNIQIIRVMISKCSSEENLETDAKNWIERNKRDAKMEDVSYRKEKINNIPIEVYVLKKIGKNTTRIYKIGYVNGCRITISGGNVNGKENVINTAFEKLTWTDNTNMDVK